MTWEFKSDQIEYLLRYKLMKLEEIHACMVIGKDFRGVIPKFTDEFKSEVREIWWPLEKTIMGFFEPINKYFRYGLTKVYFELDGFDVLFFMIDSNISLVALTPPLKDNRKVVEDKLEEIRQEIMEILEI